MITTNIITPLDKEDKKAIANILYTVRQQADIKTALFLEKLFIITHTINCLETYKIKTQQYPLTRWVSCKKVIERNKKIIKQLYSIENIIKYNFDGAIGRNNDRFLGIRLNTILYNNKIKLQHIIIKEFIDNPHFNINALYYC